MMSTWWFEMTAIFTLKLTWCCFSKYVVLDDNCSLDAKMVSVAQSRQKGVFIPPAENLDSYTPPPPPNWNFREFSHILKDCMISQSHWQSILWAHYCRNSGETKRQLFLTSEYKSEKVVFLFLQNVDVAFLSLLFFIFTLLYICIWL